MNLDRSTLYKGTYCIEIVLNNLTIVFGDKKLCTLNKNLLPRFYLVRNLDNSKKRDSQGLNDPIVTLKTVKLDDARLNTSATINYP